MRAVIQRVKEASVKTEGKDKPKIGAGLVVTVGVARNDAVRDVEHVVSRLVNMRIFNDENGKMSQSLKDTGGEIILLPHVSLLGDCSKGRRPSFIEAAPPEMANELYGRFVDHVAETGVSVQTGRFRAAMEVALVNQGPVTLIVESR